MSPDIIVIAAIAIFVLLRLRAVLGRKIGHNDPVPGPMEEGDRVIQVAPRPLPAPEAADPERAVTAAPAELRDGVREAVRLDPDFSLDTFLPGARVAFEMVIEAFSNGDRETLKNLLSKPLYERFAGELDRDAASDQRRETTLVSIVKAEPKSIVVEKSVARIVVEFESEQVQLTKNAAGDVIQGNASDVDTVDDRWEFERDLKSSNPNWKIVSA